MTQYKAKSIINYARIAAALMVTAVMMLTSCKQTITADTTPPAEVTELKVESATDGTVSLSWKNPADEDLYQIKISAKPAAGSLRNSVYLAADTGQNGSFMVEGLTNGTPYTFTIQTIDKTLNESAGVTIKDPVVPVNENDSIPPAEVSDFTAGAGNGKVLLNWKNPADEDLYQVELTASPADGALKNPVYLAAAKGSEGSFIAEGLKAGTKYTFTLKTIDRSLNKSEGVKKESTLAENNSSDIMAPREVTKLKTDNAVNGNVSLSWMNPADDDLYQVELTANPADGALKNPVYLAAAKGAAGSYIVTGLTNGTAYSFTVKTLDKSLNKSKGVKTESPVIPQDASDKKPPAEVTNLQ